MSKKMILLFLTIFLVAFTSAEVGAREKSITVGVSATYTGGVAATGKHVSNGIIDYLKWLGSRGGIEYNDPVSGKKERVAVKVTWEDNQYNVTQAVAAYKRFKARRANVIIGYGSTPGEACSASASRDKIPYLAWYAYASPAGYKPRPQYYWTFMPSICEAINPMIKWFLKYKWQGSGTPKIGIMSTDLPSWRVLGKPGLMDSYVKSIGAELVGIEFVPILTTDLSIPITRLAVEKKADCIILPLAVVSSTVVAARDIRRLNIDTKKTTFVFNTSAWDESLLKSIPGELEGMYGEGHVAQRNEDVPGMNQLKEVATWAGRKPDEVVLTYTIGHLGSRVLETAIKRALEKNGYKAVSKTGKAVRDELANFKTLDTGKLSPPVKVLYKDKPYFINYARVFEATGGKFVPRGDWISVDPIKGTLD